MVFNEEVHARIVVAFYRAMERHIGDGERMLRLFDKCTQQYGEERGRRMALRALRAGYPLNYNAYRACGEWRFTDPGRSRINVVSTSEGVYHYQCLTCPWRDSFEAAGAHDVACRYCTEIDRSIARGFNPDLQYRLDGHMHDRGRCDFTFGPYDDGVTLPAPEGAVLPFEYHCAHVFFTFFHTVEMVCGGQALPLLTDACADLAGCYGSDFLSALLSMRSIDFHSI